MKKIITICLMLAILVSMSVSVIAAPGGFIESPSNNQAPELIAGENESEDCTASLIITPYADRDGLPEEIRAKLEEAYKIIVANPDLSVLNSKLTEIAASLNINVTDLAVSDMFDVSAIGCDYHEDHGHFDITLKPESLSHFVCLLHYYNGVWRIVEDAEVTQNGEHLEFTEDEFSPFAIVVNASDIIPEAPQTGDNSALYIVLAVISGLILVVLLAKYKKSRT